MATWKIQLEIVSDEIPATVTATTITSSENLVETLNEALDAAVDVFDDEDDEDYLAGVPYLEPDVRGTLLGQPVIVRVYPDVEAMEAAANGNPDPAGSERSDICGQCSHPCQG